MANNSSASCGLSFEQCADVGSSVHLAEGHLYDFICIPLVRPCYNEELMKEDEAGNQKRAGPLSRVDVNVSGPEWGTWIVLKMSSWFDLDSSDNLLRRNSEVALQQELNYSSHLGAPAVMISLTSGRIMNLARCLQDHIDSAYGDQSFWIHVPMCAGSGGAGGAQNGSQLQEVEEKMSCMDVAQHDDTWRWWNNLRTLCDFSKKIYLVLELSTDLPESEHLDRWLAEPIKAVVLPTSIFVTNAKGYPTLTKPHQNFVHRLMTLRVQFVVSGATETDDLDHVGTYYQYINHLFQTQPPPDTVTSFAKGYEDYLQMPLQPLMDNLDQSTYEVFEKDPIKYKEYQRAVYEALKDRMEVEKRTYVVMVVGAGRGPLVTASLRSADDLGCPVTVYAVEKNTNAVITLQNKKHHMWGDRVTVVSCDMREWEAPVKADILVSELLGSFGDNELSPECLDGAQRFLKEDGISIPSSYTSFIAPIQSHKLHAEVRANREKDKPWDHTFEMPYVVRLHNYKLLGDPLPLFHFTHPNWAEHIDNTRVGTGEFTMTMDSVVTGIAGFFETVLYKDIMLSIRPVTHSDGMFSWFPILFPLKTPLQVHAGEKVTAQFWRCVSPKNVWYEWTLVSPRVLPVHNPKGRSYTIGL